MRCYDARSVVMPVGRWRAVCPGCGRSHSRHRRPRPTSYHCKACGPVLGGLIWACVPH
jgi:hypothetical protein